ncbi:hypothetical protein BKA70DRAFT_1440055 [Coprinopsis sp. MPI-PUGE-AT-0042]|nr:hypothetical protein BKA70DRAFT_1440055 [Coprinopsis sp. MPI-PUGE-AT-0042]
MAGSRVFALAYYSLLESSPATQPLVLEAKESDNHLRRRDPQTDEPRRRPLSPQHTFHQDTHGPAKEKAAYIKPVYPRFSSPPPIPTRCVTTAMILPPTTPNGSSENFTVEAHLHPRLGRGNAAFNFVKLGRYTVGGDEILDAMTLHFLAGAARPFEATVFVCIAVTLVRAPSELANTLHTDRIQPTEAPGLTVWASTLTQVSTRNRPKPFNYDSTLCNEGAKLDRRDLALVHVHHSPLTPSLS